jgi:hypothetical protein
LWEHHRYRRGRLLRSDRGRITTFGHDHVHLARDELGRQSGQAIEVGLRPAIFDRNVLALDEAGFVQSLAESGEHALSPDIIRGRGGEDADHRHRLLLRIGRGHKAGSRSDCGKRAQDASTPHGLPFRVRGEGTSATRLRSRRRYLPTV